MFGAGLLQQERPDKTLLKFVITDRSELFSHLDAFATAWRNLGGKEAGKATIMLSEAIGNALQSGSVVQVKANRFGRRIVLRVRDNGPGFFGNDLLRTYQSQNGDCLFDDTLFDESGRGLKIMHCWADRLLYNRQGTEVLIVTRLDA